MTFLLAPLYLLGFTPIGIAGGRSGPLGATSLHPSLGQTQQGLPVTYPACPGKLDLTDTSCRFCRCLVDVRDVRPRDAGHSGRLPDSHELGHESRLLGTLDVTKVPLVWPECGI